ncbi:MAG: hypothetical protein JRN52_07580 [Nitrososphaerota archaeon]|nr:hypothetical protein [Nitrososphaerota archaeon]
MRFIIGLVLGLVVAGAIQLVFSYGTVSMLAIGSLFTGILTILGLILAGAGYVAHAKNDSSIVSDLLLGFGIGLVLVAFIQAGNGSLSN